MSFVSLHNVVVIFSYFRHDLVFQSTRNAVLCGHLLHSKEYQYVLYLSDQLTISNVKLCNFNTLRTNNTALMLKYGCGFAKYLKGCKQSDLERPHTWLFPEIVFKLVTCSTFDCQHIPLYPHSARCQKFRFPTKYLNILYEFSSALSYTQVFLTYKVLPWRVTTFLKYLNSNLIQVVCHYFCFTISNEYRVSVNI